MENFAEVKQVLQEVVLVLGGVFAVHVTDDAAMRQVADGIENVYERAMTRRRRARLSARRPHPAFEQLLRRLQDTTGAPPARAARSRASGRGQNARHS